MNFCDSMAMRYGRAPAHMVNICDVDGELFDVNHTLNCPHGGFVYWRHNETTDL